MRLEGEVGADPGKVQVVRAFVELLPAGSSDLGVSQSAADFDAAADQCTDRSPSDSPWLPYLRSNPSIFTHIYPTSIFDIWNLASPSPICVCVLIISFYINLSLSTISVPPPALPFDVWPDLDIDMFIALVLVSRVRSPPSPSPTP